MNKYCNASDFTSIFIPRVFANITTERITHIVENVVPLGSVERIDIVEIDEKTNRVWVHFIHWYDTEFVNEFKKLLLDETKQAKIVYDDPWFWIVLKNTHRLVNGLPKVRIDLEDCEVSTSDTVATSTKSIVTFTTPAANHRKKAFGKYHWADVESDSDDENSSLPPLLPTPNIEIRPNSPTSPPPPPLPTYPNPYPIQHNQPYQMPPIYPPMFPPLFYHIPSQIPCFPQYQIHPQEYPYPNQFNQFNHYHNAPIAPIAPILPFQFFPSEMIRPEFNHPTHIPHPVASWNGISFDEMYMDDLEDDAFFTETDYQEMLLELDDDDIYSDEDLYNMYLIEKEELALINQLGNDNDNYDTTIVFHDHSDASLKSDEKPSQEPQPTTSQLHHRSLDKFIRPIITFKDKLNSNSLPAPHSYKDMLVKLK